MCGFLLDRWNFSLLIIWNQGLSRLDFPQPESGEPDFFESDGAEKACAWLLLTLNQQVKSSFRKTFGFVYRKLRGQIWDQMWPFLLFFAGKIISKFFWYIKAL